MNIFVLGGRFLCPDSKSDTVQRRPYPMAFQETQARSSTSSPGQNSFHVWHMSFLFFFSHLPLQFLPEYPDLYFFLSHAGANADFVGALYEVPQNMR